MARKSDFNRRAAEWLSSRNGADAAANVAAFLAIVLYIVGFVTGASPVIWAALALLVYALFRMMSKDVARRSRENAKFLEAMGPFGIWFSDPTAAWREQRSYKHFACPNCKQRIRIPRGKGKIRVTCPRCHQKFEAKS